MEGTNAIISAFPDWFYHCKHRRYGPWLGVAIPIAVGIAGTLLLLVRQWAGLRVWQSNSQTRKCGSGGT